MFHSYMIEGILEAGINQDGGLACYVEIPELIHWLVTISFGLGYFYFFVKWNHTL
jgi:hypothetical protein